MNIRMGLIGAGRMGKVFAHTLAFTVSEVDLVVMADADPKTGAEVAARFGAKYHYTDYCELLERNDIDAVVSATPTYTHAQVIKDASAAGKHIFSEKPLGQTLEMCDEAMTAAKAAGIKLQLGFIRRFDAAYAMVKKKIDEGAIGQPVVFHGISRDPNWPNLDFARRSNSGGLIMDMGVHDFDLARWLMGSEVVRIPGFMARFADAYAAEVRDFVSCILEDRTPSVTGDDARKATAIGMAATLSLDEVRPVMVSEIG